MTIHIVLHSSHMKSIQDSHSSFSSCPPWCPQARLKGSQVEAMARLKGSQVEWGEEPQWATGKGSIVAELSEKMTPKRTLSNYRKGQMTPKTTLSNYRKGQHWDWINEKMTPPKQHYQTNFHEIKSNVLELLKICFNVSPGWWDPLQWCPLLW